MKYEAKHISEQLKSISVVISLFITLGGVVIGIFNYFTLAQLQPFGSRISQVEKAFAAHEEIQTNLMDKMATKSQMDDLINRVDKISGRLDLVIEKLIK
jgi:hypothetical protein